MNTTAVLIRDAKNDDLVDQRAGAQRTVASTTQSFEDKRTASTDNRTLHRNPTDRRKEPRQPVETETVAPDGQRPPVAGLAAPISPVPARFTWLGLTYDVQRVLGHWREHPSWWKPLLHTGGDDAASQPATEANTTSDTSRGLPQVSVCDRWRVEATPRRPNGIRSHPGVYELVCRNGEWTLDRVWD